MCLNTWKACLPTVHFISRHLFSLLPEAQHAQPYTLHAALRHSGRSMLHDV